MIRFVVVAVTDFEERIEGDVMKIAVTARGVTLDDEVDPRFGRAPYILVVDTDSLEFEAVDNSENVNAFKGAGIQAATMISEKGAEVLLTGYCGPNAFKTVDAAGIKVVNDVSGTVREAVEKFKSGPVEYSTGANVEGHW
jgi:predicted Fe-Mo cluster-binding NifX family protein